MKLKVGIIDDEQHAIDTLKYDILDLYGDEVEIVFTETRNPKLPSPLMVPTPLNWARAPEMIRRMAS